MLKPLVMCLRFIHLNGQCGIIKATWTPTAPYSLSCPPTLGWHSVDLCVYLVCLNVHPSQCQLHSTAALFDSLN